METASSGYQDIKNALIQKNITHQDYIVNTNILAENLKQIEIFLADLEERTVKLLARLKIQISQFFVNVWSLTKK